MAKITLKGNAINTIGELPAKGTKAPCFKLTATDLSEKSLEDYKGTKVVLNIFPSLDTPTCAASVRRFINTISLRQYRWCGHLFNYVPDIANIV